MKGSPASCDTVSFQQAFSGLKKLRDHTVFRLTGRPPTFIILTKFCFKQYLIKTSMENDELDAVAREFLETMIRVNSRFREERLWKRREDLSLPQFILLLHLYHHGPTRVGAAADNLRVSQGVVTRMADRLVKKGLVTRSRDPEDRRVVFLALSPQGKRLVSRLERERLENMKAFLRSLPARERKDLLQLFERIRDFLEKGA